MSPKDRLHAIAEAMVRTDIAIEQLTIAARRLQDALPAIHDVTVAADLANERARVARAKIDIVLRRMQ